MPFVLCANHFINQDDNYRWQPADQHSRICGVFSSREAALSEWKVLEHQIIRQRPLSQILDFIEMPEQKLKQIDAWVQAQGAHSIIDDFAAEQTIAELNTEQVFEFVNKIHIPSFQLLEWQNSSDYFIGWLQSQQNYLTRACDNELDTHLRPIIYATSAQQLLRDYVASFNCMAYGETQDDESAFTLYGSLTELSHTPEALAEIIKQHKDIRYDEGNKVLLLDYDVNILQLVYPHLKQAPLRIEQVTLQQLCILQAERDAVNLMSHFNFIIAS